MFFFLFNFKTCKHLNVFYRELSMSLKSKQGDLTVFLYHFKYMKKKVFSSVHIFLSRELSFCTLKLRTTRPLLSSNLINCYMLSIVGIASDRELSLCTLKLKLTRSHWCWTQGWQTSLPDISCTRIPSANCTYRMLSSSGLCCFEPNSSTYGGTRVTVIPAPIPARMRPTLKNQKEELRAERKKLVYLSKC